MARINTGQFPVSMKAVKFASYFRQALQVSDLSEPENADVPKKHARVPKEKVVTRRKERAVGKEEDSCWEVQVQDLQRGRAPKRDAVGRVAERATANVDIQSVPFLCPSSA